MRKTLVLMVPLCAAIAFGASAAPAAAGPVMPYGTYVVKGSIKGDYNTVLREDTSARVRTLRASGPVIAESEIRAANAEGINFILEIPIASVATPSACVVGETLDCALVLSDGTAFVVPACLKVDSPLRVGLVSVNCTEVKTFVNPRDGSIVEIPVSYLAEAQAYLPAGEVYDPWGDYDGDGSINFAEFRNGTNPFDATDFLRILDFTLQETGNLSLRFEHVGGHVYAVSAADSLVRPAWANRRVRETADSAELEQVLAPGSDGEPGVTEIYITPVAGATSEFFRLEGK